VPIALVAVAAIGVARYRSSSDRFGSDRAGSTFGHPTTASGAAMTRLPTVAAPCPEHDDMLALEGYAPGAGGAEHLGQKGIGQLGGIAGGIAGAPDTASTTAGQCRALAPAVEDAFRTIDSAAQALPSDGYDESARAAELPDANAIFAFVRDRVRTVAYAGVMRGGVGTLMSRGGSPTDKALLLSGLLGVRGIAVRFVHSTLSDADAARVIAAALAAPAPVRTNASSPMPAPDMEKFTGGTNTAQPIADQIIRSLAGAGGSFATSDAGLRSRWSANVRDHWWVQAQEGSAWVDLDPTLSAAAVGSHVGPTPRDAPADALPDSLFTTMTFRVAGDFVDGTGVTTRPLVEKQVRAADAYAQPITVQVGDADATVASLATSTAFTATVSTGGGAVASSDPFQPDAAGGARLLRLRLEIETDRPGYRPLVARRTILDRSGAGGAASIEASWTPQRTAYALTTTYYGLAMAGDLDPAFTIAREVEATHALHALLEFAINRDLAALPQQANEIYPLEVMHYLELDGLVRHDAESQSPNRTRFYFDRPAIAFVRHTFVLKNGQPLARNDFDVVDDAMDATGANVSTAVHDNVVRGVVDDAIEANVLLPKGSVTTRALFAIAARSGVPVVAVRPSAPPPPLPPMALAAARASLERGGIVATARAVAAGGDSHVGWWEVDPETGSTIGRLESGAGQALVEGSSDVTVALKASSIADVVGGFDGCAFGEADEVMVAGQTDGTEMHKCEGDVICEYLEDQAVGLFAQWLYGESWNAQEIELWNKSLWLGKISCG
jgi:transglutaminase-like putative cysteine protease